MQWTLVLLLLLPALSVAVIPLPDEFYEENEYRFRNSFRPPFFVVAGNQIPFWRFGGTTGSTEDFIRMTTLVESQVGWLSNTQPVNCEEWEVIFEFAIGGGGHIGGDGIALWLLPNQIQDAGGALGGPVKFNGLGIMFDSFDNDHRGDNPKISVLQNDGSQVYTEDGKDLELASCVYSYRNSHETVVARIRYQNKRLSISVGLRSDTPSLYYNCVDVEVPNLRPKGYWSITAATGGLKDHHDLISFTHFDLNPSSKVDVREQPEAVQDPAEATDKELHRIEQESSNVEREEYVPKEHHVKQPLATQFKSVYEALKGFEDVTHPEHKAFAMELNLPKDGEFSNEKDRLQYILETVFAIQRSHEQVIRAFEEILTEFDRERTETRRLNGVFAEAFSSLYTTVASKEDVEDALTSLSDRKDLVKLVNRIHDHLDSSMVSMAPGSPLQTLSDIGREIPDTDHSLSESHQENAKALEDLQSRVVVLLKKTQEGSSLGVLDYLIFFETALFLLFLFYSWRAKKKVRRY